MRLSRRGLVLGGAVMLSGCGSAARLVEMSDPLMPSAQTLSLNTAPVVPVAPQSSLPVNVDGVREGLTERALNALDGYGIRQRDYLYVVDFTRFSGEARLHEVDLQNGRVKSFLTAHGRGSDPDHSGFPRLFSNTANSYASSLGVYKTAGMNEGRKNGPNVLLDGLDDTNSAARSREIIVHGADYCDPAFLQREGKLGRSYGCFSVSHADLSYLRPRMGNDRLILAVA